ncbi:hypothetical protein C2I36_05150 [Rhodobacteraceae bacterium WD3A24]|nr:hypothetical protein C2I36_05150 [Rhodobacteraceae bacterium WD3A24]
MGETLQPFATRFNKSLRVERRTERLTGDAGVVPLREIMERSGIVAWMIPQLTDPRRQEDVVHDLASLIRTSVLLAAQGWRDHDDADALRDDPAFRLVVCSVSGSGRPCHQQSPPAGCNMLAISEQDYARAMRRDVRCARLAPALRQREFGRNRPGAVGCRGARCFRLILWPAFFRRDWC